MANSIARSPMITIITSTFQAAKDLPITAASIRSQTYKNVQWIIADGGSSDGTVEWIQANLDVVSDWFSSPDRGIYDAWNKALPHALGEWIQFLGAGDELAAPDVLERFAPVLESAHPKHDLVYGRLQFIAGSRREVVEEVGVDWSEMKGKWEVMRPKLPVHPEVFHHRSLFLGLEPFDLRFSIAADSHFLLRAIAIKEPLYHPVVVDRMLVGGTSARYGNALKLLEEIQALNVDLGIKPPLLVRLRGAAKAWARHLVARFVPATLGRILGDAVRRFRGRGPLGKLQ